MGIEAALPALSSFGPALQIAGAGMNAFGAFNASSGAKAAYNAQAQVAENNAKIAEWQAQDATARGAQAVTAARIRTGQMQGDQRAALAANGVDLGVGSALQVQTNTDYFGQMDANTVLANAAREAWGYRTQESNFANNAALLKSRADAESPWLNAGTSLLTSAGRVASGWYRTTAATTGGAGADPLGVFMRGTSGSGS